MRQADCKQKRGVNGRHIANLYVTQAVQNQIEPGTPQTKGECFRLPLHGQKKRPGTLQPRFANLESSQGTGPTAAPAQIRAP